MKWSEKIRITKAYWKTYNYYAAQVGPSLNERYHWQNEWGNVKQFFLYQEPNPDYLEWKKENCTLVSFFDWIPQHLPKDYVCRIQIGGRNNVTNHYNRRPVLCIETGEYFPSADQASKKYNIHGATQRSCYGQVFVWDEDDNPYRFTWIDPFIPAEEKRPFPSYESEHNRAMMISKLEKQGLNARNLRTWYNNGVEEIKLFCDEDGELIEEPPEGYVPGRLKQVQKKHKTRKPQTKRGWEW